MQYDANMQAAPVREDRTVWYRLPQPPFLLEGLPFSDATGFRRLPEDLLTRLHSNGREELAQLALHTAGGAVRFRSRTGSVQLRVRLAAPCDMYHMAPCAQGGFDCYLRRDGGPWQFAGVTNFPPHDTDWTARLWIGDGGEEAEFLIHFPLYQAVDTVEIGLDDGAPPLAPAPRTGGTVVVYGTSIDQGACASRPGMGLTAQLGRIWDAQVLNLSFSGNAFFDNEVAEAICRLPSPRLLLIDAEANAGRFGHLHKLPQFLKRLRSAHPAVPMVVLSSLPGPVEAQRAYPHDKDGWRSFQASTVEDLRRSGDTDLWFLDGTTLWPDGGDDCTVDGVHPNDLGFTQLAGNLAAELDALLHP